MGKPKLTDIQLVVLTAAAARESGMVLPVPKSLDRNRGTLAIVLRSLLSKGMVTERPALLGEEAWATRDDVRYTMTISKQGLEALGIEAPAPVDETLICKPVAKRQSKTKVGAREASAIPIAAEPGRDTKLGGLILALRKKRGATLADLMVVTGWQAHSVRGAISGPLKKKLGLSIVSESIEDRGRVYRIEGQPR